MPPLHRSLAIAVSLMATIQAPAAAQSRLTDCRAISDAAARLACYDQLDEIDDAAVVSNPQTVTSVPPPSHAPDRDERTHPAIAQRHSDGSPDTLSQRWELEPEDKFGRFRIVAYKPTYFLFARYSGNPNRLPSTPAPGHEVATPLNLDSVEAKFQLSFKTKALENLFGGYGDLWLGYTQQSSWQVYNSLNSAPFRETNYEPEAFLTLRTNAHLLGFDWKLVNLGVVHQSNGRNLPLSRSWNRVYAQFGLERGNLSLFLRPWLRINESANTDDNPGITDFMGHGDLLAVYQHGNNEFSALTRYSGVGNRATVQLDWHFPLIGALKGYVQLFSGYGETLIDYNIHQNTIGVGVSLTQWQ